MFTQIKHVIWIACILLYSSPVYVYSDTYVGSDCIIKNTTFTKSKSPYVIREHVSVKEGVAVTVEKGATIIFDGGSLFFSNSSFVGSDFTIVSKQTTDTSFMISGDSAYISLHAVSVDVIYQPFISAWNYSHVSVSDTNLSSISNQNSRAIEVFNNSSLKLENVSCTNFQTALYVFNSSIATTTNSVFSYNTTAIYTHDSEVFVHTTDFIDNHIAINFFISDTGVGVVDASNNWWGKDDVPPIYTQEGEENQTDVNALIGNVVYFPRSVEPNKKIKKAEMSNVLFLPGLMGSRLYKKDILENQLWEPNKNKDVKKLFLDSQGKSIEQGIYTRDVIAKTNLAGGVSMIEATPYKDFVSYMNQLVKDNLIQEWKAAPYDWRYAPDTILEQGILVGDTYGNSVTKDLVAELIYLAKTSKTKKVTLVAHSNGGLVGKQLMIELQKKGLDGLVDTIIFVGMPEYGTPQAITSLLYGHEQSIAGGFILSASVAKQLGVNMPTAYTLLPSVKYFETNGGVSIDGDMITQKHNLNVVLTQKANINNQLLHKADDLHATLDAWIPPSHLSIYQIVGTGVLTTSGLMQDSNKKPIPTYNTSGDGVVQDMYNRLQKTYGRSGISVVVDLYNTKFKHADMMNATAVISKIHALMQISKTGEFVSEPYVTHSDDHVLVAIRSSNSVVSNKTITVKGVEGVDVLKHNTLHQLDESKTLYNTARYDLFDTNIQYISKRFPQSLYIQEEKGDVLHVSIFQKDEQGIRETVYDSVQAFKDSDVFVSKLGFYKLEVSLPVLGERIHIPPVKDVVYDDTYNQVSVSAHATTTEDLSTKILRIQNSIRNSRIVSHVKNLYISRLGQILKSKNPADIVSLKQKVDWAISDIDKYAYSPALKSRYAKLRESYIYIRYLLEG